MLRAVVAVVVALFAVAAVADEGEQKDKDKKLKKPGLDLRYTPRFSFSPARISFTAELKGGDDVEELYCPEIEWEWGDGGRSVEEADCDPWAPGGKIERRFTANHVYPNSGIYPVRVTLRKSGKSVAAQTVSVSVRAGVGDRANEPSEY